MKFSYSLLKKLVPAINPVRNRGRLSSISNGVKNKHELIEKLNLYFFEAEDMDANVLDISIPANRFSDAASHWGIATEISAILGRNFRIQNSKFKIKNFDSAKAPFKVEIQDKKLCPRYAAQYFEDVEIGKSPKWLQDILIDCGIRPINNVVDIVNYAMLETGQPLHAFDYDKIEADKRGSTKDRSGLTRKQIIIRRAKKGERITTLENKTYDLNENILVISDLKSSLAIAGIKGGKRAEVDKKTKKIILEAANFNGVSIYKSSKILNLSTDASLRFSHNISSDLVAIGLNRAAQLFKEIVGAKAGQIIDVNFTKPRKRIIKFDLERFKKFIGLDLDIKTCRQYFERLGFKITRINADKDADKRGYISVNQRSNQRQSAFLVEAPPLRLDIERFEDLAEEIIRLYGFNKLKSQVPQVHLQPSGFENQIILKDKIRKVLTAIGLNEVYNYSFIGEDDLAFTSVSKDKIIELENPVSRQLKYLRPSLASRLIKNINNNFRFFDEIKIFEIGKIFFNDGRLNEKLTLGIALASKNKKGETRLPPACRQGRDGQVFFELRGLLEQLFKKIGLVNYLMPEITFNYPYFISGEILKIESDGLSIGYLGRLANEFTSGNEAVLSEIDLEALLKLIVEEHEYRPLPKYPSVMRDISILVEPIVRVGEIIQAIQESDLKYIEDVDLIDEYDLSPFGDKHFVQTGTERKSPKDKGERSLTFRIIFQAEDRTLTDKEVNEKMGKIEKMLKSKFVATIR